MPAISSSSRPMARPIPGATWSGDVTDAQAISKQLTRLWADVAGASAVSEGHEQPPATMLTRASTLNLTAVARSRADAERAEHTVARLGDLYPSRATILVADPARMAEHDPGMAVRIVLLEQEAGKGRSAIRFEQVSVEVSAENEQQLASIASPLLVADLPDFLWWVAGQTGDGTLFADLCRISDRLIVDTAGTTSPAIELGHLLHLLEHTPNPPRFGDFAWRRLDQWRNLLTQFFDPPATRAALSAIADVEITYGAADPGGCSGFTGALLLAGWLASRLEWQAPGDLVRARNSDGWRVTMRASEDGRHREVAVTIKPAEDPIAGCGLASVALTAHGDGGDASFRVEQIDEGEIATYAKLAGSPTSRRMVSAPIGDDAALLADELRQYGHDGIYEASLAIAALLCPGAGV
jgi:glucose-6-phosphate dehydrogenase assembly protein OpcA